MSAISLSFLKDIVVVKLPAQHPWTHVNVLLGVDARRQASLCVVAVGDTTAEVPQGSVQHPGGFQVGRVDQVVATLGVETDPLAVGR